MTGTFYTSASKRMRSISEERLVFDVSSQTYRPFRPVERYIRTIPFSWMRTANRLPGKVASVAVALWFLAGVKRSMTFRLTAEAADLSGASRKPLYRALAALEGAGLISVTRRAGARPVVTIHQRVGTGTPELVDTAHTEGDV